MRIPNTNYIGITPSGISYDKLLPQDIVILDLNGKITRGNYKPSSELPLHLEVYKARVDITAIVHTHSIFASSLAVARQEIPPIIEDLIQCAGGNIRVANYALPGTIELAHNAVNALADNQAVLLANHGVLACGSTLPEAVTVAEIIEKAAQILINAKQLGALNILSNDDVTTMRNFYLSTYRKLNKEV